MKKKLAKLGAASLLAAGAGVAIMAKNKKEEEKQEAKVKRARELAEYRNTERGRNGKNQLPGAFHL